MEIILLAENHYNSLGLVRSFGESNHTIHLVLKNRKVNFVAKSKYVKTLTLINDISELNDVLVLLCSNIESKPLLIVSTEEYAEYVDANYFLLNNICYTEGGCSDNSILPYRTKSIANKLALECGLCIPRNWEIFNKDDMSHDFIYPVLVKTDRSVDGWKNVMKKCDNRNELQMHLNTIHESFYPLQVQQYIRKEYEMMIQGVSINHGSQIYTPVGHRKIRFYPKEYSLGCYSESFFVSDNDEISKLSDCVKKFIRHIHYTGLFSAEFLYSKGVYYFLETNLRNDATSIVSTRSGYNLPDALCKSFEGKHDLFTQNKYQKTFLMHITADFHNVMAGRINLIKWIKQLKQTRAFCYYDKQDVYPFFYYLYSILMSKF